MDFVLAGPPHIIRRNHAKNNFDLSKFTVDDVKAMVSICCDLLNTGSFCHIICNALQYEKCFRDVAKKAEKLQDSIDSGD